DLAVARNDRADDRVRLDRAGAVARELDRAREVRQIGVGAALHATTRITPPVRRAGSGGGRASALARAEACQRAEACRGPVARAARAAPSAAAPAVQPVDGHHG